jgi:SAM-dependent methyltransferase
MSDMNRTFSGSMPEFYDQYLVPMNFLPFALDMADRLRGLTTGHVLETAAGTGVVTRAMTAILPESVAIVATDLNPAMLEHAKSYTGMERVHWQEANALTLPFPDQSFDRVVCQFGVMFFPDKAAGFREALRVLRPGGQFLFNVWGDRTGTLQQVSTHVLGRIIGRDPKTLGAPDYYDITVVTAELAAAGFAPVQAETLVKHSLAASARQAAIAQCHGGLQRMYIDRNAPERLDEITDAVTAAIESSFGSGPIDAPLRAILFTATRPAA